VADRIHVFQPVCGAGSTAVAQFPFPAGEVTRVDVTIPKGHCGLTTMNITYGDGQVIPQSLGESITGDGETFEYEITTVLTGSQWEAGLFNGDVFAHEWQVTFFVDEIVPDTAGDALPVLIVPYV
jgi:hypothetical protein